MSKLRRIASIIGMLVIAVTAYTVPASAAVTVHVHRIFSSTICTEENNHACVNARSRGIQLHITHSNPVAYQFLFVKNTNSGGNGVYQLRAAQGCLRGNGSGSVTMGSCLGTDTATDWVLHTTFNGLMRIANYKQGKWLGTFGTAPGRPIWLLRTGLGLRSWFVPGS